MFDGSGGVDADGELFVGEELGEEGEEAGAVEVAALDEGEGAGAAEVARRVGGASPDGFELNVTHALEKELVLLVFERGEGFGDGVLGPALWVGFDGVVEEAGEGGGEVGNELC